jgi:hypothetical protein
MGRNLIVWMEGRKKGRKIIMHQYNYPYALITLSSLIFEMIVSRSNEKCPSLSNTILLRQPRIPLVKSF